MTVRAVRTARTVRPAVLKVSLVLTALALLEN